MERIKRFRPSPPLGLAFVALFVALSGAAIALPGKNQVDSGDIENKTIKTKDLSSKTADGLEGPRGPQGPQGPAGPAGQPGGGKTFSYQENAGAAASTEVNENGLEVSASCAAGGQLNILLETTSDNALVHVGAIEGNDNTSYREDDNFDTGDIIDIDSASFDNDSDIGQIIYQSASGGVTTVQYIAEETGGVKQCNFSGSVVD